MLIVFSISVFVASVSGIILWFQAYDVHDYHLINYLLFIPITILGFLSFIKNHHASIFNSIKYKAVFLVITLICIYYGYGKIDARYHPYTQEASEYSVILSDQEVKFWLYVHWHYMFHEEALSRITPYLRSIGITKDDLVYAFPDESTNISLYLMNQNGFTNSGLINPDYPSRIIECKDNGAKYVILLDTNCLQDKGVKTLLNKKIGQFENIQIYDIFDNGRLNTNKISCGAEEVSSDNKYFIGKPDSVKFGNTGCRTNIKSYSGNYSVLLNKEHPFGFTTKFQKVKKDQLFFVTIWRYCSSDATAGLCVSTADAKEFYLFNSKSVIKDGNGWEKILLYFNVPENIDGKDISLYVWNQNSDQDVYFDNIEVNIY
ncbi:MAG: hypothetical protein WC868_03235 [Bacteroidales bacterium]